ncbi:polysaccharide biosynthesis protein [Candidatus Magnetomonas plexicatena]|uniref:polysaccharide biosynthesis protein n=1 Tax=Candidatus Magnetomonas plexicatena TaxID=2552947 RepID=UPI001100D673|nr:polysaccharide biosynthesis protein [Nitrospirales bacterium LBB_01]
MKRKFYFILSDTLIIAASLYLAFYIRFDFSSDLVDRYLQLIVFFLPIFMIVKVSTFYVFRIYSITWRYVGLNDLIKIVNSLIASEMVLIGVIYYMFLPETARFSSLLGGGIVFPRSIVVIDWILSLMFMSAIRISKRLYHEILSRKRSKEGKSTIIIGAGNSAEMLVREISRQLVPEFNVIGFLDDDPNKIGAYVHSIKVLGKIDKLRDLIYQYNIQVVIIAITNLDYGVLKRIYEMSRGSGIKNIKITPMMHGENNVNVAISSLEDLKIEDLIGRQVIKLDYGQIKDFLSGNKVVVFGAGGSIGSEVASQLCALRPSHLVLFDMDETAMFNIENKLSKHYPALRQNISYVIGNITDTSRVEEIFMRYRPDKVYHAAAYKHVPMMEHNPTEAIKVNVLGTHNIAELSERFGVKTFIMLSTDKAVNPCGIMGATKRAAEELCRVVAGNTSFISVRFGNVLGSRGSVLPLMLEQLRKGGPLTVTHRDMERYFMTIPEAVSLVLQASVIGQSGDIMILDMGKPVRILELAEELIRLHGMTPYKDIDIEFIGLRPAEKLREELYTTAEKISKTSHEKILTIMNEGYSTKPEIDAMLEQLRNTLQSSQPHKDKEIRDILKKYHMLCN